jgi:hypothetical protein
MTEDQSGQEWEGGYAVRGEVVGEDQPQNEQAAPVTYFHKVASAARRDEPDPVAPADGQDEVAAVTIPDGLNADDFGGAQHSAEGSSDREASTDGSTGRDYWDVPPDDRDDVVPVTRADALASSASAASTASAAPLIPVTPIARAADTNPMITVSPPSNYGSLLPDSADLRSQWQQIQFMFVDDPRASVTEAADVVEQVAAKLQEAIRERQRSLRGRWEGGTQADTETLRETLRMYRAFLYQLIGSSSTPGS